jgi:S1-C subfamily serine protease
MRRAARGRRLALAAILVAGIAVPVGAEPNVDPWGWLRAADPRADALRLSPSLTPEEQAVGLEALRRHVVTLAVTRAGEAPEDPVAVGAGVVVDAQGVVATSWHVVARVRRGGDTRLWARRWPGPWMHAVPVGETWYADVALLRLVVPRPDFEPVRWAKSDRARLGKRVVAAGAADGQGSVVASGLVSGIVWFDPLAVGGRVDVHRTGSSKPTSKDAVPLLLLASDDLATTGGLGSGVFAADGTCLGLVGARDPMQADGEHVVVRAAEGLRPFLERLASDGTFAPADPGFRLGAAPRPPSRLVRTPPDLVRVREAKERSGAIVSAVSDSGPAVGTVWPGDVVLALGGQPTFDEAPESIGLALLALRIDEPAEVLLWRGGKRVSMKVVPRSSRGLARDPQDVHDDEGAALVSEPRD